MNTASLCVFAAAMSLAACHRAPESGASESAPAEPRPAPTAPAAPPTGATATAFTARFLAYVRHAQPDAHVRATGDLEVSAEGGRTLPLANLTAECAGEGAAAATQCEQAMERWTRVLLSAVPAPVLPANVRASLFPDTVIASERARAVTGTAPFVGQPWVGPLWLVYVADSPDAIATITPADQAHLGLDDRALHDLALANLRHALPEDMHGELFSENVPGIYVLHPGDSYGAARLILHERWAPLAAEQHGDLLAAGPARDIALYASTASEREVWSLRWLAQEMYKNEPHPMSPALLRWTPAGWELFDANTVPVGRPPAQ